MKENSRYNQLLQLVVINVNNHSGFYCILQLFFILIKNQYSPLEILFDF